MIQESYVTFEQAKALKELGFPQSWRDELVYFTSTKQDQIVGDSKFFELEDCYEAEWSEWVTAPTLSLVQKWLREEKELYISIVPTFENRLIKASGYIVDINYRNSEGRFVSTEINNNNSYIYQDFETYEQALSAGIDKCIELLKH